MGAGASSHSNKPEVHVVVVQQRESSSNVVADNTNMDDEVIHTALKAAKLNGTKEARYVYNIYRLISSDT